MQLDRNGLEVLDRDECLRLLGTAVLGRVGVSTDAMPAVLPVNYRLAGDRILFRAAQGTKLDAATRNAVVAFEVDAFDPLDHTGWSVMVTGIAHEISTETLTATTGLHPHQLPRWAPGGDGHVVAVSIELISGRRILTGVGADRPAERLDRPGPAEPG